MTQPPILNDLEAEWTALKARLRSEEPTPPEALQNLLRRCIDAGRAVSGEADRVELQWTAREIGDAIFSTTREYPHTVIAPAGRLRKAPLHNPELFTDREKLLAHLEELLQSRGRVVLHGLPGVGKTMIARHYAFQHGGDYESIVWLNAHTRDRLEADCREVARDLGLVLPEEADWRRVFASVRAWLEGQERILMVLDNADELTDREYLAGLRELLPSSGSVHVLITTRLVNPVGIAAPLPVVVMTEEDGAKLLLRRAGRLDGASAEEWDAARAISREVAGLALALDQAGAYIASHQTTPARYLELYRGEAGKRLRERPAEDALGEREPVAKTVWAALDEIERRGPAAADLLWVCAMLGSEPIPEEIFTEGAQELGDRLGPVAEDELALDEAIRGVARYSLVQRDAGERTVSVHPVIQAVIRDGMTEEEERQWAERVVRALNRASAAVESTDWGGGDRLLPHLRAGARLVEQFQMRFGEAGRLLKEMSYYLVQHAQYAEAKTLYERAIAILQQTGDRSQEAGAWYQLAAIDIRVGDYPAARTKLERALAVFKKSADRSGVALVRHQLASISLDMGEYRKARGQFQKVLRITQEIAERAWEAEVWYQLAAIDLEQRHYAQAQRNFETALKMFREIGDPAGEVRTSHGLATIDLESGNSAAAWEKFARVLPILQEIGNRAGEAAVWHQMATLEMNTGEYRAARERFQRSLVIEQEIGNRAGEVVTQCGLASLDIQEGHYRAAREKLGEALKIAQEIGDRASEAIVWNDLATTYLQEGDYDAARDGFTQARRIAHEAGDQRGEVDTLLNLASLADALGDNGLARSTLTEALAMVQEIQDRAGEAAIRYQLASLDVDEGNDAAARDKFDQVLVLEKEVGDRVGETATWHQLGTLDLRAGEERAAREKFARSLELAQEIGGREAEAVNWQALAFLDLRASEEQAARQKLENARAILKGLGDRAGEAATWHNLAMLDAREGQYEAAHEKYRKALALAQEAEDPHGEAITFGSLGKLAAVLGKEAEGARLLVLSWFIESGIAREGAEREPDVGALAEWLASLGCTRTPEQARALVSEVQTSYRADRGGGLMAAAFGKP